MNPITSLIPHIIAPEKLEAARAFIAEHQRFVVSAHLSPDGDAVGSSLALKHYLKARGKEVVVVFNDTPGENLAFIPGYRSEVLVYDNQNQETVSQRDEVLQAFEWCDAMIGVDFNVPHRLGDMQALWMKRDVPRLLIDHHLDPDAEAFDIIISHPEQAAACELVFHLIVELGDDALINHDIATTLFCGLMTDTGWFVFNCDRPDVHLIQARLVQEGVNREQIIKDSHLGPERRARLTGFAMSQKMRIEASHRAAYISLSKVELKRFNHQKGDSEGLVNMPLDIVGVEVSALFREEKGFVKVSLRSKGEYPVNQIASRFFNGGGHRNAAGGEFYGSLAQAETLFVKALPLFDEFLPKKD